MSDLQLPPTTIMNTDINSIDLKEISVNDIHLDFDNTVTELSTQDDNNLVN